MRYLLLFLLFTCTTVLTAQDYADDYAKIDSLVEIGQYRSALTVANSIFRDSENAGRVDHLMRSIDLRVQLTRELEEDGDQAALDLLLFLRGEAENSPILAGLLDILIGETYFTYAGRNSYRLRDQTEVSDEEVSDSTRLAGLTMGQLLITSRTYFYRGLATARANRTQLTQLPALIAGGKERTAELPTIYDLLIDRTMNVLGSSLGSLTDESPADAASLLVPAADFCELDLTERYDTTKGTPRKLLLYQEWIEFHLEAGGPALLYADLERMKFVHRNGVIDSFYLSALEAMYTRYDGNPLRDRILVEMAGLLDREDNDLGDLPRVKALELLNRVGDADEFARVSALQLRNSITAPRLDSRALRFYPRKEQLLVSVDYRNVERLHYRVYPFDAAAEEELNYQIEERLQQLMRGQPTASGTFDPDANDDYSPHTTEINLAALPVGAYRLVLTDNAAFTADNSISITNFQVTDLATIKIKGGSGEDYVQVTDRTTGAAIAGVSVAIRQEERRGGYRQIATRKADSEGKFSLPAREGYGNYQLVLTDGESGDRLVTEVYGYREGNDPDRTDRYTTLLTDRNIYRPGQTVHVYGLRYQTDPRQMPTILAEETISVILRDANYQEVEQRNVKSDAYGRFSFDFVLPEGGLTGQFTLQTAGGGIGFQVEEYKRPRFEATFEQPRDVDQGETITIKGRAVTYAGPPVTAARVSYRVYVEESMWSYYFSRRGGGSNGERELLLSSTTETDDEGNFSFDFTAPAAEPSSRYGRLRYVVEADVADQTGETHVATTSFGRRGEKPAVSVTPDKELLDTGAELTINALTDNTDTTLSITLTVVPVTKPNAALTEREWGVPDRPIIDSATFVRAFPNLAYGAVPELSAWLLAGDVVFTSTIAIEQGKGRIILPANFPVGHYRIDWRYDDGSRGEPATFAVYDSERAELPAGVLYHVEPPTDTAVVGTPLEVKVISAVDLPLLFGKWQSRRDDRLERTVATRTHTFTYTPTEEDRGGLYFSTAFIRLNAIHRESFRIDLPWDNKELTATYATLRDKLRPGAPERWTITLRTADSIPTQVAALATMYDASLDQLYSGEEWQFSPYPQFYAVRSLADEGSFGSYMGWSAAPDRPATDTLPELPELFLSFLQDGGFRRKAMAARATFSLRSQYGAVSEEMMDASAETEPAITAAPISAVPTSPVSQSPVQLRTNLQETAFWLPDLTATADGALQISFTSPEALTAWKFRLFAHDKALNYTISEREIVTQKELMVLPNVPRFVREGDRIELTGRVSNLTEEPMQVTVELELFNAATNQPLDPSALQSFAGVAGAIESIKKASLTGGASETLFFTLNIPEGASLDGPLGYRIIARSDNFSDGEENVIPVLSDRTLVTVSQPFYLKRGETKKVTIPGLADLSLNPSLPQSLVPISYTFQATTNPAWLALKSLPYLMESSNDCVEQLANRYFANQLAYATVSTKPALERVFRQWQADSTALLSELEKNQDLKNALLEETPWVREAQSEAEQRARIADLFQLKRLATEQQKTLAKLVARQESDGSYSWFPGGRSDRYMTQYVVETIARMRQLEVIPADQRAATEQIVSRAIRFLDAQLQQDYDQLFARTKDSVALREEHRPSAGQIHYLYARSLSGAGEPKDGRALKFVRDRAVAVWTEYGLYEQALLALSFEGEGASASMMIVRSLRERALHDDEFGMYWKYDRGYRWNNLPIETHTRILEAFQKIDPQQEELDEMRLWLLSNKRTNAWPTTKATAAAVYAILNTGSTYVAEENSQPIEVSWRGALGKKLSTRPDSYRDAKINNAEAATGEFTVRIEGKDVTRDLATATVKNPGNDLVWGGAFWQYTELASRVEASNDGPLSLERQLYKKVGNQLLPITENDPLSPGDRVTVKLTLRSDRDLDYVHLKDRRATTFEPVDALSTYQYQGGLGYYFAPQDLATNFFIDHLPRGTYVLEYDLFVTYRGSFSNGLGRVQCMYAPEFGALAEGGSLLVR